MDEPAIRQHDAIESQADELLGQLDVRDGTLPVLVDGELIVTEATVEKVATAWGGLRPPRLDHYDFVVVGAGTAGCAVANRLSASGRFTVLLLEAGGEDRNPWIHIPLGTGRVFNDPNLNWRYESEPEEALAGRRMQH